MEKFAFKWKNEQKTLSLYAEKHFINKRCHNGIIKTNYYDKTNNAILRVFGCVVGQCTKS